MRDERSILASADLTISSDLESALDHDFSGVAIIVVAVLSSTANASLASIGGDKHSFLQFEHFVVRVQ